MTGTTNPRTRVDGGIIIAHDGHGHKVLRDGVLVYEGNTIVHVGQDYQGPADRTIDARDNVVAPGFVSMHSHLANSPLTRSFREDRASPKMGMSGLYEYLNPISGGTTPEMARASVRFSALELVRSGITTIVDLTEHPEDTVEVATTIGMRAYVGPYFRSARWRTVEGTRLEYDWLPRAEEERGFERAVAFVSQHNGPDGDLIHGMLVPAQLDTCRPELLEQARDAADQLGVTIQTHAAQSVLEFSEIMQRYGKTPVELLHSLGLLRPNMIIGHCIFTAGHSWLTYPTANDIGLVADGGASVAHCPWVFGRYGIALESFSRYLDRGVRMSLGTDTFPQSMLFEMRAAASFGKFADRNGQTATAGEVFTAATAGGADGLGRQDLGRLGVGAKADFVCYRRDTLSMSPLRDPVKNLVYSALPSDVNLVVINGREVLKDGQITGFNESELARDLQRACEDLWAHVPENDWGGRSVDELSPPSLPDWVEVERSVGA